MKTRILAILGTLLMAVGIAIAAPTTASAGSNNGTSNWYWKKYCYAGGLTATLSNYDMNSGHSQEYHGGQTTSGSITGYQPSAVYRDGVKVRTSYLRDWFDYLWGDTRKHTYKFVWSKPTGSTSCSIYG